MYKLLAMLLSGIWGILTAYFGYGVFGSPPVVGVIVNLFGILIIVLMVRRVDKKLKI